MKILTLIICLIAGFACGEEYQLANRTDLGADFGIGDPGFSNRWSRFIPGATVYLPMSKPTNGYGVAYTPDFSGSNNNGIVSGATWVSATNGYLFNGTTDYIDISSAVPMWHISNPYSFSVWIKGVSQTDNYWFGQGSAVAVPIVGFHSTATKIAVFFRNDASVEMISGLTSTQTVFDDTWHHIAWTDTAGTTALYVDGIRDATDFDYTTAPTTLTTGLLGALELASVIVHFAGSIDEFKTWPVALTSNQVLKLSQRAH